MSRQLPAYVGAYFIRGKYIRVSIFAFDFNKFRLFPRMWATIRHRRSYTVNATITSALYLNPGRLNPTGCGVVCGRKDPGVNIRRRIGRKSSEWLRRYLPNEIVGTVGELGGAGVAYLMTGSFAAAAIAGTVGASVGYYAVAYGTAVRWCYAAQYDRAWPVRVLIANLLALRSVVVEFGPAEGIDSLVVRPLTYYVGPIVLGNALLGSDRREDPVRLRVLRLRYRQLRAIPPIDRPAPTAGRSAP